VNTEPTQTGYPSWIPESEIPDINLEELITNEVRVENARKMLEDATGFYFASYRVHSGGRQNGLCHTYRTAPLSPSEMELIKLHEAALPGIIFVAYQRPLQRIRPLTQSFDPETAKSLRPKIWVSWSSGKDSYAALRQLWAENGYEVECVFTTVDPARNHIPMHAVSIDLLKQQVDALGIQHRLVAVDDEDRNAGFLTLLEDAKRRGVNFFAFGDLFLEEIRCYREQNMAKTGIVAVFPVWLKPTEKLILDLITSGMRAIMTSIDLSKLPASFLGRELTVELVGELVARGCDPCGEHGEYHSFVFDGPLFHHRVNFKKSEPIIGDDFAHLPLIPEI
jgi:uncharacterized protein (TIGR00290 family)